MYETKITWLNKQYFT